MAVPAEKMQVAQTEQKVKDGAKGLAIREYPLARTRNIGIMAHIDAGKTTTTERILYYTGKAYKIGEVHEGTAADGLDGPGARARHHDHLRRHHLPVEGPLDQHHRHPRPRRLHGRGRASLRVLDGAVAVFDAVAGVEPQTETVWRQADRYDVPRICFVNKMDRTGADFERTVEMIVDRLARRTRSSCSSRGAPRPTSTA